MKLGVIRYKIWTDIWGNKARTLQVVAIIAIGAFAVGAIIGGRELIIKDLARSWQESEPATIALLAFPPVDAETIGTLEELENVETVSSWLQETVKYRLSPDDPWKPALLVAVDDYDQQTIRQIQVDDGVQPHGEFMGAQRGREIEVGDQVYLEARGEENLITIQGVLYNAAHPPPVLSPEPMFFTTAERFEELTGISRYSLILATTREYSDQLVEATANLIQNELEDNGVVVHPAIPGPGGFMTRTSAPDRHSAQDSLDGVFLMLTVMAIATLILGLFLVYNTINAMITQQVRDIGVMKAIGANFKTILVVYFLNVLIFAILALVVAVPIGAAGANKIRMTMLGQLKITPGSFEISRTAVMVQAGVALLSPMIVAIFPILKGAGISVLEAISSFGTGKTAGVLDRILARFEMLPRTISLTISNTFSNKIRVLLTQIPLIGAGLIFLMVFHTRTSLLYTFGDVIFDIFQVNVLVDLKTAEDIEEIETITLAHPGVQNVEVWGAARGKIRLAGEAAALDDMNINLRGLPIPSITYAHQLRDGHWLTPEDTYGVILNQELAEEIGIGVGEEVTIEFIGKHETNWEVVGLVFEPLDQTSAILPRDTMLFELDQEGKGRAIRVQTEADDAKSEASIAEALQESYSDEGFTVIPSTTDTAHRLTERRTEQVSILVMLLTFMAILTALVGAVALSGTLSLSVLERTREIGVMRAIGAPGRVVAGQFIGEGVILGWLSWLLAIPLSIPVGRIVVGRLSELMKTELVFQFSVQGVLVWFLLISILSVLASWFPAQKANQTSVKESLAYE